MAGVAGFNDVEPLPTVGGVTFAGHHVVSQKVFDGSPFFQALKTNGFDANSFASNGIPLPNKPAGAVATGMAYHAGGHPAYNDWQKELFASFEADFQVSRLGRGRTAL